jgi:endopeptidase La
MPNYVKKCVSEKIEEMKTGSSEYYKQLTYVKMLLNYPWPAENEHFYFAELKNDTARSREFLDSSKKILDDMVYGHEGCKSAIQEMIAKWLSNPKAAGKAIGLHGNPGIGKTLIAKGLGKALNIPFVQINLGGLDDGCVLCGHSYTYSAAQAGLIVKKMIEAGSSRCIMYFDELDKACKKHDVNEVYNILIHLTDPNTNQEFSDRFFQEINFPLDKVLFVFSYNSPELVDKILRDRLQEIEVKPYTLSDKLIITKQFLIKEICEGIGLNKDMFVIKDNVIEYLIENYTHESGVREIKRKIESLFLKLNIDKYYNRGPFNGVDITSSSTIIAISIDIVNEYLKKPKINIRKIHSIPAIGIINGLYATTTGQGGLVPIMINPNFTGETFELRMTGSHGKVMKESVEYSYTTAINLVKKELRINFLENHKSGLHVHTPDGSTPKDGPSAGCAFTIAFISVILGKKIRHDCALTGEIEPTGKVSAIGGLHYKLIGAKKAGVKTVFVPQENEEDYQEIKDKSPILFDENFAVIIVDNVYDILKHIMIEDDGSNIEVDNYLIGNKYTK